MSWLLPLLHESYYLCTHTNLHTHTHSYLLCVPASGCCYLMGLYPPPGQPALPPAGWGPAPDIHCTSSLAGTNGSVSILPAAKHAAPQFDAAPLAPGGQQNTKMWWYKYVNWVICGNRSVIIDQCMRASFRELKVRRPWQQELQTDLFICPSTLTCTVEGRSSFPPDNRPF